MVAHSVVHSVVKPVVHAVTEPGRGESAAQIPGSPVGWWDASDTSSITLVSTKVSQWNDKAGSNHFTQGTDALRPSQTTINSKNALEFNDAHYMLSGLTRSQPTTFYVAMRFDALTGTHNTIFDSQDAAARNALFQNVALSDWVYSAGTSRAGSMTPAIATTYICTVVFDSSGGGSVVRINGSEDNSLDPGSNAIGTGLTIGADNVIAANRFLDGAIGEMAVYAGAHSGSTITDIEAYLTSKWT